jgi:undecaprenyl-phosphate galactose phosphotransferase/putative colanic acid biosynthesis UDP-glucose lipid carrier transferase
LSIRETVAVGDVVGPSAPAQAQAIDVSGLQTVSMAALACDALVIVSSSLVAGVIYSWLAFGSAGDAGVFAGTGALAAAVFCAITRIRGTAAPYRVSSPGGRARAAAATWIGTFLFLTFLAFTLKVSESFSRGAVLSFFFTGLPLVVVSRIGAPRIVAQIGQTSAYRGLDAIVLAARNNAGVTPFLDELRRRGCAAPRVIAFDPDGDSETWAGERLRLVRRALDSARMARPGDIYIVAPDLSHERVTSILSGLRLVPRAVFVVPNEVVSSLLRSSLRSLGNSVAIEMQREPMSKMQRATKRVIDIAVAAIAALLLTPLFACVAVAIKLDSPGPVFFRQVRNGYRSRPFRIWKFRTMGVLEDGPEIIQASRHDQRVTRVGRFLRRTSLDECPQLFNVLAGEMSLVGPRPHAVAHDELYAGLVENYELRQHVKPGITGWAQVNGHRGGTPTVDFMYRRIEFDLWYAANCSLSLDWAILFRTLGVFLAHRNAY